MHLTSLEELRELQRPPSLAVTQNDERSSFDENISRIAHNILNNDSYFSAISRLFKAVCHRKEVTEVLEVIADYRGLSELDR